MLFLTPNQQCQSTESKYYCNYKMQNLLKNYSLLSYDSDEFPT